MTDIELKTVRAHSSSFDLSNESQSQRSVYINWRLVISGVSLGLANLILTASTQAGTVAICLFLYLVHFLIFIWHRLNERHRAASQEQYQGNILRYFFKIHAYQQDSILPWWYIYLFFFGHAYLSIIFFWLFLEYPQRDEHRGAYSCGGRDLEKEDSQCLAIQGATFAGGTYYLALLISLAGVANIPPEQREKCERRLQSVKAQYEWMQPVLQRSEEIKEKPLEQNPILSAASFIFCLAIGLVTLMVYPEYLTDAQNASGIALYFFALPLTVISGYLLISIAYSIWQLYATNLKRMCVLEGPPAECKPFHELKNAQAWWAVRSLYMQHLMPLSYSMAGRGLLLYFLLVVILSAITVGYVFGGSGSLDFRLRNFVIVILFVGLASIVLLYIVKEASKICEAQLRHIELLRREKQQFLFKMHGIVKESERIPPVQSLNDTPFACFVDWSVVLIEQYDMYPTLLGFAVTPSFFTLISSYLVTALATVLGKIGVES